MLVLLRSDVLAHESPTLKICFQLFDPRIPSFSLDLGKFVEPHVGHLSCKSEPWIAVGVAISVFFGLGDETNVFGADNPGLDTLAPGDLDVFSVGL